MKQLAVLLLLLPTLCMGKPDTISTELLQQRIEILSNKVDEVKRDQLNYSIEKNLLKEVYSNNYERINLFLTAILALMAVFGYLGIKDIHSTKKEYGEALVNLKKLHDEIESKSSDFEVAKEKYDKEIKDILIQNEEQNRKIKLLEIKEKINQLFEQKQYASALEFCIVALENSPNDMSLLIHAGRIYTRQLNYEKAIRIYEQALEIDSESQPAVWNLFETYLFTNTVEKLNDFKKKYDDVIRSLPEKVKNLFEMISLF